MSSKSNITCHWYRKPTDTGIVLYFCSCALLQHKINMFQGTVHRVFIATSNWLVFDQAMKKKICRTKNQFPEVWSWKKNCRTKSHFPEVWSSKLVNQTSEKIIRGAFYCQLKTAPKVHQKSKTRSHDKPSIFYNTEAPLHKALQSNWGNYALANGFYNAKIKILPRLWNHFSIETWNPTWYKR